MMAASERAAKLREVVALLGSLIENPDAENAILPGDGYDEAMLVGSSDSYLLLAKTLVEVVSSAADRAWADEDFGETECEGIPVSGTNRIKYAFDEFSPVWVMCAYLASDDAAVKELMRRVNAAIGLK